MLKQKKAVEAELNYYRDIRHTIGPQNWEKIHQTANDIKKSHAEIEARKAEIRAEVRQKHYAEYGKSNSNVIGD